LRKMKFTSVCTVFRQQFGNNEDLQRSLLSQTWRVSRCFDLLQFGNTQQSVDFGRHLSKRSCCLLLAFEINNAFKFVTVLVKGIFLLAKSSPNVITHINV
jgi:hypothetical protein